MARIAQQVLHNLASHWKQVWTTNAADDCNCISKYLCETYSIVKQAAHDSILGLYMRASWAFTVDTMVHGSKHIVLANFRFRQFSSCARWSLSQLMFSARTICLTMKFTCKSVLAIGSFVIGDVSWAANQSSIAALSYVKPSCKSMHSDVRNPFFTFMDGIGRTIIVAVIVSFIWSHLRAKETMTYCGVLIRTDAYSKLLANLCSRSHATSAQYCIMYVR